MGTPVFDYQNGGKKMKEMFELDELQAIFLQIFRINKGSITSVEVGENHSPTDVFLQKNTLVSLALYLSKLV